MVAAPPARDAIEDSDAFAPEARRSTETIAVVEDQRRRAPGRRRARARRRVGGLARGARADVARGGLRRVSNAAARRGGGTSRETRRGEIAGRISRGARGRRRGRIARG